MTQYMILASILMGGIVTAVTTSFMFGFGAFLFCLALYFVIKSRH